MLSMVKINTFGMIWAFEWHVCRRRYVVCPFSTVSVWLRICAVSSSHCMLHSTRTRRCGFPSVSLGNNKIRCVPKEVHSLCN